MQQTGAVHARIRVNINHSHVRHLSRQFRLHSPASALPRCMSTRRMMAATILADFCQHDTSNTSSIVLCLPDANKTSSLARPKRSSLKVWLFAPASAENRSLCRARWCVSIPRRCAPGGGDEGGKGGAKASSRKKALNSVVVLAPAWPFFPSEALALRMSAVQTRPWPLRFGRQWRQATAAIGQDRI